MLPAVQYLKKHYLIYFLKLLYFLSRKKKLVPIDPSWPKVQVSVLPLDILIFDYKLDFRFYTLSHGLVSVTMALKYETLCASILGF